MNIERLVSMANDIGDFFQSEAGENAPKEIAGHITRYWDPRMRLQIIAHAKEGGEGLSPNAKAAALLLTPPQPRS